MDLRWTDEELAFRDELRAWLADAVPALPPKPHPDDWEARRAYDTGWQRQLHDAGYAGISWPVEYGGRGATPAEELLFLAECEQARAPYVGVNFVGLLHAGPTIMAEGTPEQKAAHLPRILRGEEVWCQGFSEPSAGSDLASLRTRAVRDGDDYVVTGSKIWTTNAQVADCCELLVRTDPEAPKHRGLSWLIMDMHAPGIDIRPLRTLVGSAEFSEVYLDDVRVPVTDRMGAEHDGWRVAMVTFGFERGTSLVSELLQSFELLGEVVALARRLGRFDDAGLQRRAGHLAAELDGLWALTKRTVSQAARTGIPGTSGNVFKLSYAETRQRLGDLAYDVLERAALTLDDVDGLASGHHVEERLRALSVPIAAGTSQIQRNILAERVLGLPKG